MEGGLVSLFLLSSPCLFFSNLLPEGEKKKLPLYMDEERQKILGGGCFSRGIPVKDAFQRNQQKGRVLVRGMSLEIIWGGVRRDLRLFGEGVTSKQECDTPRNQRNWKNRCGPTIPPSPPGKRSSSGKPTREEKCEEKGACPC